MFRFVYVTAFVLMSVIWAALALAADPFTVTGIPVDSTGDNAIEAQTTAISEGQVYASELLIARLTLPQERASKGVPPLTADIVAPMIRALSVANEKRSTDRYLGDITVAFNPSQVQQFLRGSGLTMITTQARPRLVLPTYNGRIWTENAWSEAWANDAFANALTPINRFDPTSGNRSLIDADAVSAKNLPALRQVGARFGVEQILLAEASGGSGNVSVAITDVSLDTGDVRNLGRVSSPSFVGAAWETVERVENEWKEASVSLAQNAQSMPVSVLYRSHQDWMRLQDAINNSSQIQDARLDALSKDGALMTITYGGDLRRLANELGFKGVEIKRDPELGMIIYRRGRI